jgi:dCMP deaminase
VRGYQLAAFDDEASRPTLDELFMDMARLWSYRSTCEHLRVGAVLVRDGRAIATGYNGSPPGMPHCRHTDTHKPKEEWERCTNTNHAEGNVLAFAAKYGQSTQDTTLYCTHSPCKTCSGLLVSAGVHRVVFSEYYQTEGLGLAGVQLLDEAGVTVDEEPL